MNIASYCFCTESGDDDDDKDNDADDADVGDEKTDCLLCQ